MTTKNLILLLNVLIVQTLKYKSVIINLIIIADRTYINLAPNHYYFIENIRTYHWLTSYTTLYMLLNNIRLHNIHNLSLTFPTCILNSNYFKIPATALDKTSIDHK